MESITLAESVATETVPEPRESAAGAKSRFEPDRAATAFVPRPASSADQLGDSAAIRYRNDRIRRWDALARIMDRWTGWGGSYHARLHEIFRFLVPPGQRVLEIGCAGGDLLAAVQPAHGVGIDFSREMLKRAAAAHPQLQFVLADAHDFALNETFDFILISDLLNDVWDVQTILQRVAAHCHAQTRIIVNWQSRLWEWPLQMTGRLGLAKPTLSQNWLLTEDVANLLHLAGLERMRSWQEILLPLRIPLLERFFNRFLVKLWPIRHLGMTHFIVAAPQPAAPPLTKEPRVSVVVPCRNEAGNIPQIMARVPDLGGGTELIFVEGNSTDETYAAIERAIHENPQRDCKLFRQSGKGKGDAVRKGFAEASGDVLMILDADLTVAPEDLPRFYDALRSGRGEFINGVRLVYPMENRAMRFFNLLGNKFFSGAFAWLLGQRVKDSLCGTKVLWKRDYERIAANRAYFGDFDPFGDFDLLFGAAKLNLRIVDLPIRYRERTYGETNIQRWKHGLLLLRMTLFAAARIKFV